MKKKLVFYMEIIGFGGAEKYLNLLYSKKLEDRYDIKLVVVTSNRDLDYARFFADYDVVVIYFKKRRYYLSLIRILFSIYKYFKSADIIHFNKISPSAYIVPILFASLVRKNTRIATEQVTIPIRSKYFFKPLVVNFFIYLSGKSLNKIIACCKASNSFFIKHYKYDSDKVHMIYTGVRNVSEQTEIAEGNRKVISIVGRVDPAKNQLDAVRILQILISSGQNIILEIIGGVTDEQYKDKVVEFIKIEKLDKHVRWIGNVEDVDSYIMRSLLIMVPSLWEEIPNVIREAGILHRVTAAYDVGGIKECIIDGESGLLVQPRDYSGLANKIEFFLKNDDYRRRLEGNIYKKVIEMFDINKMIDSTMSLYESH